MHFRDEASSHQLPIAVVFWIIWIVSTKECLSLTWNLMRIHCSTRSVILHMTATQYTWSLNCIYHLHWPVQWSHCSHTPVHSPWLPGYINVAQIVLVMLMAGLFQDRLYLSIYHLSIYLSIYLPTYHLSIYTYVCIYRYTYRYSLPKDTSIDFYFIIFLEREDRKERERNIESAWERNICCLLYTSYQGSNLQPRYVPWLGMEPLTFLVY